MRFLENLRRPGALLVAPAFVLVLIGCGSGTPFGQILSVERDATVDGEDARAGMSVHHGSVLRTGPGQSSIMKFETEDLGECLSKGQMEIHLRPDELVAAMWARIDIDKKGVTICLPPRRVIIITPCEAPSRTCEEIKEANEAFMQGPEWGMQTSRDYASGTVTRDVPGAVVQAKPVPILTITEEEREFLEENGIDPPAPVGPRRSVADVFHVSLLDAETLECVIRPGLMAGDGSPLTLDHVVSALMASGLNVADYVDEVLPQDPQTVVLDLIEAGDEGVVLELLTTVPLAYLDAEATTAPPDGTPTPTATPTVVPEVTRSDSASPTPTQTATPSPVPTETPAPIEPTLPTAPPPNSPTPPVSPTACRFCIPDI
jgi:hypothetical protein